MKHEFKDYDDDNMLDYYKKHWEELRRESESIPSLDKFISMYGVSGILKKLLMDYSLEHILENIDIQDIQQYLRKKKLENIKDKDND